MIPEEIQNRKGARNTASVPPAVLDLLNRGRIETKCLCEWLVTDQFALAETVFARLGWEKLVASLRARFSETQPTTAPKKLECIGRFLAESFPSKPEAKKAIALLLNETSDIARSWGAYLIGSGRAFTLREKFRLIRPFAADPNMSVREMAWMAMRPDVTSNLTDSIAILRPFAIDMDPSIRRFASELTRPRGVWCSHIKALKDNPSLALPLLEPMRADPSKYVQDSVANWLNDASKSDATLITETCSRWSKESPSPETARIVKRSMRTLRKG
jgi:3-methyladenine DNA glycosylase AlkC